MHATVFKQATFPCLYSSTKFCRAWKREGQNLVNKKERKREKERNLVMPICSTDLSRMLILLCSSTASDFTREPKAKTNSCSSYENLGALGSWDDN